MLYGSTARWHACEKALRILHTICASVLKDENKNIYIESELSGKDREIFENNVPYTRKKIIPRTARLRCSHSHTGTFLCRSSHFICPLTGSCVVSEQLTTCSFCERFSRPCRCCSTALSMLSSLLLSLLFHSTIQPHLSCPFQTTF